MSRRLEIKVPDIGDFRDVPVIEVLVAAGDAVGAEQSLLTLESEKATMEIPAPAAGVISELRVAIGDKVSEGDVVAVIETGAAAEAPPAASVPSKAEAQQAARVPAGVAAQRPAPVEAGAARPSRLAYASPAIRRFARELGVDLLRVVGSGRGGRILREDLTAFVKSLMAAAAPASGGPGLDLPPPPKVDFARYGEVETRALSRIQKASGARLHRNWIGIPHVTQHELADTTDMEAWRKANAARALEKGFKLTPLVFLIKASVAALRQFPDFNASLDESRENLVLKKYFHIGIAVDTPAGLVVPVIRDCDRKDIHQLAAELAQLSRRAREGKLEPVEMQGGCFSISSLGGIGGTAFTPIINAPEVAILGVSRATIRPQWDGKTFQPRTMLPLSLSYDHRVIDGASAARFVRYLAGRLENFGETEP